jgi:hypothetical protein
MKQWLYSISLPQLKFRSRACGFHVGPLQAIAFLPVAICL